MVKFTMIKEKHKIKFKQLELAAAPPPSTIFPGTESRSNCNLEMLAFEERGETEVPWQSKGKTNKNVLGAE